MKRTIPRDSSGLTPGVCTHLAGDEPNRRAPNERESNTSARERERERERERGGEKNEEKREIKVFPRATFRITLGRK